MDHQEETSVKFIRLVTGEDLLANVLYVEEDDIEMAHYYMYEPLRVMYIMNPNDPGMLKISFTPWIMTEIVSNQEFYLDPDNIIAMATPDQKMVEYYDGFFDRRAKALAEEESTPEELNDLEDEMELRSLSGQEALIMLNNLLSSREKPREEQ